MPLGGETIKFINGYYLIDYVRPGSPVDKAGMRPGDTLVSMNWIPIEDWEAGSYHPMVGDTIINSVIRNNKEVGLPVIVGSVISVAPLFFWSIYILMMLFSVVSLYFLYKKPYDKAVLLIFIYLQFFMVTLNAQHLTSKDPLAVIAELIFTTLGCFLGPILIHFHLIFPKPAIIFSRYKRSYKLFYIIGALLAIGFSSSYIYNKLCEGPLFNSAFDVMNRILLWWLTVTYILAFGIAIYQFLSIKDTLSRNQLRIVILGTFFSCITPISISLFYNQINELGWKFPHLYALSQGIGGMIMIICFLIAIFRYRIWDMEIIIRKALLYIGATIVIILTYLFLIWIVNQLIISENNIIRFIILGVSVIIFLVLRDRMQRLIDRIFHRETYDSATVVSDFEAKLAGIYRFDELKHKIVQSIDEIFHFKFFVFNLKKNDLIYEPAFVYGIENLKIPPEFEITEEIEDKLGKSKVFSPEEVNNNPPILEMIKGDLIVPMVSDGQPNGFFICGQKKSERIYSRQDINVLTLLARRVIALLHTASLYQKDLDRQLMLERERARISQDMHDDIGAGLTKIAMISEAPVKIQDTGCKMQDIADCRLPTADLIQDRLNRIATTSRDMISRLNVIVWALNPKYDNLESLISYLRRYFGEYLENFGIQFKTDLPEQIPEVSITPDTRRNIFYAVQEAMHNSVKHSGCSEISLVVKIYHQQMEITITDNGKGFDKTKPGSGGNGLLNMKKRAEDLGGSFEIRSEPGKGTRVYFDIKVK